jgi:hypothetical protein
MDLRKMREVALAGVEAVNTKDSLWGWHLTGLEKDAISIRWGYLDEIWQKEDFRITYHKVLDDEWLAGDMGNDFIDDSPIVTIGNARWDDAKSVADGIVIMIRQIARIAHSRY